MGDLILMSRSTRPSPAVFGASADILFFTGVRYQRMPDAEPVVGPIVKKSPVRRRTDKSKKVLLSRRFDRKN